MTYLLSPKASDRIYLHINNHSLSKLCCKVAQSLLFGLIVPVILYDLVVHRTVIQIIPLPFATTTTMLLLLLTISNRKNILLNIHSDIDMSWFRSKAKILTYRDGSWSCLRVIFRLVEPSSVPLVSGIAPFPL